VDVVRARIASERFELIRSLGTGGSGAVFEALERTTQGRVALKILHRQTGFGLLRFKQEFRALAELSHPNVVRFGGLFEEAGQFYFTMELVEGDGLFDYVRPGAVSRVTKETPAPGRSGTDSLESASITLQQLSPVRPDVHTGVLDVGHLRDCMAQLASGLIALHAAGLVHRDVKPQNVLVAREGRVVLLDFGLVVGLDDLQARDLAGTPAYMAPEQAMAREVTGAADWYAFGAVLYEGLTGRRPHSHLPMRNVWAESHAEIPHPANYVDGLPEDLTCLCMDLLRYNPGERPDETTIARRLGLDLAFERARASFRSQIHFARSIFVARHRELGALRAAARRASEGALTIVHIEGESGIGKSALLRQFVGELGRESPEIVMLGSRCYERETISYRGIDGVIDSLVQQLAGQGRYHLALTIPEHADFLAQVFPVFRALRVFESAVRPRRFDFDPQEARKRAFSALREMFQSLTQNGPLLIYVDDAQWIDAESVALLNFLLHERALRTLFLIAARPTPSELFVDLMDQSSDVTRIVLEPLSVEESEQLVGTLLQSGSPRLEPAEVAKRSGGHPLFIHELVLHGTKADDAAASWEAAVESRLGALDSASRRLLDVVAIAGAPLQRSIAQVASRLSPEAYPWVLSTLRSENLVSFHASVDNDVQVYHDRIRDLLVAGMDAQARRITHLQLAEALEQRSPDDLDALAHHFAEADQAERAKRYALAAGERSLQKVAFEHAARLFQLALRFEHEALARGAIEEQLGHALANSGRGAEAAKAYLRAAELAGDVAALELRRRAAEQLLRAGHVEEGTTILFAMLRELGLAVPEQDVTAVLSLIITLLRLKARGLSTRSPVRPISARERLRLDACWTLATGLSTVHHLRSTEFQARTLLLALHAGDTDRVLKSAALLSVALGMAGGVGRRIADRFRALASALAADSPSDENIAWLELTLGVARMADWDFETCEELCARAEGLLRDRCAGASWEIATTQAFALWSSAFRGNFQAARKRLPELLESARSRGDRHAETSLILSPVHLVGLAADEPARVRRETETSMAEWPSALARFQHMCGSYVLAQVDLYEGKVESASLNISHAWEMLRRSHFSRVQFQRVDLLGLRARVAVARAAALAGHARRSWIRRVAGDVRRLRGEAIRPARAMADLVEGAALHLEGDDASSAMALRRASAELEQIGMHLHARVAALGLTIASQDAQGRRKAEQSLFGLGVLNAPAMLRLWLPGMG
jgi:hypothetical protein